MIDPVPMNVQEFTAILLRVCGIIFVLSTIPLLVDMAVTHKESAKIEEYYAEQELGDSDDDSGGETEGYIADQAYAISGFPDMTIQISIHLGIGCLLILLCNPISKVVVLGIVDGHRKNGSE